MAQKFAIPKVNFLNITLNGKQKAAKTTDEPHILQYKADSNQTLFPEASVLGILGEDDTALFSESLNDVTSIPMSVDLTLSITTPNIFLEFFKKDILKYVHIRVMQSTKADLTDYIANNYNSPDAQELFTQDPSALQAAMDNELFVKDVMLDDFLGESPENNPALYNSIEVAYDSDGFKTYTFPYNLNFEVLQEKGGLNVEHLAYFAFIQVDISKIFIDDSPFSSDDGISLAGAGSVMGSLSTGIASSQVVISAGKVNNYAQIFYETPLNSVGIPTGFPELTDSNGNIIGFDYSQSKVWTGPVHYHGSDNPNIIRDAGNKPVGIYIGYMAGAPGADMGPYLTPVPTINGAIRDFRLFDKVNGVTLNYSDISRILVNSLTSQKMIDNFKGLTTGLSEQEMIQENPLIEDSADIEAQIIKFLSDSESSTLFTEPYVARDGSGNVKLMFGMNYLEILKRNSAFPKLIDLILTEGDESDRQELLGAFKVITDFRVYRNKVHPDNPADPTVDLYEKIENEDAKLIISTSQGFPSQKVQLKSETLNIGGTDNKTIAGIQEMEEDFFYPQKVFNNMPSLRFFTIFDGDVPNDGDYVYSIEIKFQDPIIGWMENRVNRLEYLLSSFENFYKDVAANPLNYNLLTNRFTDTGKQYIADNWDSKSTAIFGPDASGTLGTYVEHAINQFMIEFIKFIDLKSVDDEGGITGNFGFFISVGLFMSILAGPQYGSPSGQFTVYSLMKEMYLKVLNAFSLASKYKKPVDSQHVESQYAAGSNPRREYTVEHKFKYKLEASENYKTGYDYLSEFGDTIAEDYPDSPTKVQQISLKKMNYKKYEDRANKEVQKLFPNPIADLQMNIYQTPTSFGQPGNVILNPGDGPNITKYCYFSPSVINFENIDSQNMLNNGTIRTDVKELNRIMLNILKYNAANKENLDFPVGTGEGGGVATGVGGLDSPGALQSVLFGGPGGNNEEKYDLITMLGGRQSSVLVSKDLIIDVENEGAPDNSFGFALDEFKNIDVSDNILNSNINPFRALITIIQNNSFNVLNDPRWTWEYYVANNEDVFYQEYLAAEEAVAGPLADLFGYNTPLQVAPNHVKSLMIDLNSAHSYENTNLENLKQFLKEKKPSAYEYDLPEDVLNASNLFGVLPKIQESPQRIEKAKVLYQTPEFIPFYMLNYKNIAKVEVLVGYHSDQQGNKNLNNPKWQLLTQGLYHMLADQTNLPQASGKLHFLCRLRRYEKDLYGVKKYDILDLPIYNEYFIITMDSSMKNFYENQFSSGPENQLGVVPSLGMAGEITTATDNLEDPTDPGVTVQPDPSEFTIIKTINIPGITNTTPQTSLINNELPEETLALQGVLQKAIATSTLEDKMKAKQEEIAQALQQAAEDMDNDGDGVGDIPSEPTGEELGDADQKGFIIINGMPNGMQSFEMQTGGVDSYSPREGMPSNELFKEKLKGAFKTYFGSNGMEDGTDTYPSGFQPAASKMPTNPGDSQATALQFQQQQQQQGNQPPVVMPSIY